MPSPLRFPLGDLRNARLWTPRAWFSCAKGEAPTLLWLVVIHLLLVVGLAMLPWPPLSALIAAAGAIFLGGLGTTIVYHRALAHRSVALLPPVEQALIFCAMFNGSGAPRNWVAMHRHHHSHSDKATDISSPHHGGFWWSHLRWLWQADQTDGARHIRDLGAFRYRIWSRMQVGVLIAALGAGAFWFIHEPWPVALAAMLWIGPVRLALALHTQCSVNSLCHLGSISDHGGSSRNVPWLVVPHMGQGENWHANHHRSPGDPRIGKGWQLDLGWWTIRALAAVRLATVKSGAPRA